MLIMLEPDGREHIPSGLSRCFVDCFEDLWGDLGAFWVDLMASLGPTLGQPGRSWAVWEPSWGDLGDPQADPRASFSNHVP